MNSFAICAEGLSKEYVIGGPARSYKTLRDAIMSGLAAPIKRLRRSVGGASDATTLWALKDVSFEINPGEVVGIIGRNGAGKSTLLKILSRITAPTKGSVRVRGRVASLLEIGTGFHPELTGRENVFLNGAILGMSRREIQRKFDEIVAFAEVEKFLDTPVKRYSSGMSVRLAFAVAAHLETDIVIVDEVLAVGDAEFQKKCIGKMQGVAATGRTVLFVSHNLPSVELLCNRCLLVEAGQIAGDGVPNQVISQYLAGLSLLQSQNLIRYPTPKTHLGAYVESLEMLDIDGYPKSEIKTWDDVRIRVNFHSEATQRNGSVVIKIFTSDGHPIALLATKPDQSFELPFKKGRNSVDCLIRRLPLSAGEFHVGAALAIPNIAWIDERFERGIFLVGPQNIYGGSLAITTDRSLLAMDYGWQLPQESHA